MTDQTLPTPNKTTTKGLGASANPWRNRIVGQGEEPLDQFVANPRNCRVHPKNQIAALAGSLDEVGWVQQVLVDRRNGYVFDGHARVALALTRNEPTVPVLYVELEADEERTVLASLDPAGSSAPGAALGESSPAVS